MHLIVLDSSSIVSLADRDDHMSLVSSWLRTHSHEVTLVIEGASSEPSKLGELADQVTLIALIDL